MQYSNELREAVLRRLLPPQNESINKVASAEESLNKPFAIGWQRQRQTEHLPATLNALLTNGVRRINFSSSLKQPV